MVFAWILTLSILLGQLVKIPVGTHGGITALDLAVISLCLVGLRKLSFKLKKPPLFIKSALFFIFIALLSLILTPLNLQLKEYFTALSYTSRFSLFVLLGWIIYSGAFNNFNKLPRTESPRFSLKSLQEQQKTQPWYSTYPRKTVIASLIHLRFEKAEFSASDYKSILLFSGVGLAVIGLLQFIFIPDLKFLQKFGWDPHYFRTASTFLDPNFLGAFLVLTLTLMLKKANLKKRDFALFSIVYLALMTTFSRGSYLAFLTNFGIVSLLNKSIKLAFLTVILFLTLLLSFNIYQRLVAQPRSIDRSQSAQSRFDTWQQGLQLFYTYPILGVGFNTYKYALREYRLADERFFLLHGSSTNDASILYVAATTGLLGLITYFFFLLSLFWTGWKNYLMNKGEAVFLIGGLTGLIAQSVFANTLFYPPLLLWVILMASKLNRASEDH